MNVFVIVMIAMLCKVDGPCNAETAALVKLTPFPAQQCDMWAERVATLVKPRGVYLKDYKCITTGGYAIGAGPSAR